MYLCFHQYLHKRPERLKTLDCCIMPIWLCYKGHCIEKSLKCFLKVSLGESYQSSEKPYFGIYHTCANYLLGNNFCVQELAFLALNIWVANHSPEEIKYWLGMKSWAFSSEWIITQVPKLVTLRLQQSKFCYKSREHQ